MGSRKGKQHFCPTCRHELEHSLDTYEFSDASQQIRNRFDEWLIFISGMCERCQAVNMEGDPIVTVTNEHGTEVTMRLSVAKCHGYSEHKSVQGQATDTVNILYS